MRGTADEQRAANPSGDVWHDCRQEDLGPGRPENKFVHRLVDDHRVFQATEVSTESFPFVFSVGIVLWPTVGGHDRQKVVRRSRPAVGECMARYNRDEVESSWVRHATEDAKSDDE